MLTQFEEIHEIHEIYLIRIKNCYDYFQFFLNIIGISTKSKYNLWNNKIAYDQINDEI